MARLTEFGFERDNRTDITNRLNNTFRNKFGANLLLTDDSIAGLLRSVIAERSLEFEKLLEDVYYSRTLNGAEGIALDDAASYFGFTRRGPQPSSGIAHIELVDNGTNLGTSIGTTSSFSADNGLTYVPIVGGNINENITGAVIDVNALVAGDYDFFITNVINGGTANSTITLAGTDTVSIDAFASELVTFVQDNTEGNVSSVFADSGIVYVGYGSTDEFIGLAQPVYFESADLPTGFTWWAGYAVEATTDGFNTLEAGGINGLLPTFTGYVSATSTKDFNPGSENETDAEFRFRIQTAQARTPVGTRDALVEAVGAVDNVEGLRLYDNPTITDRLESDALTFNFIVRGGVPVDIAQAIYDNKPIGRNTSGTNVVQIATADGETEEVRFTIAEESSYDLRVTYTTNNTSPLSAREIADVKSSVSLLLDNQPIGQGITNSQLISSVLSAVSAGRLLDVQVEVKRSSQGAASYNTGNLAVSFDQYLTIGLYEFERSV